MNKYDCSENKCVIIEPLLGSERFMRRKTTLGFRISEQANYQNCNNCKSST